MKYYIYVSESKIDMLFSQIARSESEEREASLSFDFAVLKGELKEARGIPANKFTKLNTIVKKLNKEGLVGSIEEEKPYIKGSLRMTWVSLGFMGESPVTFWGYLTRKLALGLAGSTHHLLGEQAKGRADSASLTGPIVSWLLEQFGDSPTGGNNEEVQTQTRPRPYTMPLDHHDIANATWLATNNMMGQQSNFEFVAKVLHRSNWPNGFRSSVSDIILATPLYVAMMD